MYLAESLARIAICVSLARAKHVQRRRRGRGNSGARLNFRPFESRMIIAPILKPCLVFQEGACSVIALSLTSARSDHTRSSRDAKVPCERRCKARFFLLLSRGNDRGEADLCPLVKILLKRPTDSTSVKQAPPISRARSFVSTWLDGISLRSTTIPRMARIVKMHVSRNWNSPSGRQGKTYDSRKEAVMSVRPIPLSEKRRTLMNTNHRSSRTKRCHAKFKRTQIISP
jgi:hypothetical protein